MKGVCQQKFNYVFNFFSSFFGKGWEQGVIGMKKGGKRLIAIPSALAYGEKVRNTDNTIGMQF